MLLVLERQAALFDFAHRVFAERVRLHLLFEEARCDLVRGEAFFFGLLVALLIFAALIARVFFDLDVEALSERSHRFGERRAFELHHEVDGAARLLAAEAVEKPAIGIHVEAWRSLAMEGAQPDVRPTTALERGNGISNDLENVCSLPHSVDCRCCDHAHDMFTSGRRGPTSNECPFALPRRMSQSRHRAASADVISSARAPSARWCACTLALDSLSPACSCSR